MAATGGSRLLVDLLTGRVTGPSWAINPGSAQTNPFRPDREIAVREHDIL